MQPTIAEPPFDKQSSQKYVKKSWMKHCMKHCGSYGMSMQINCLHLHVCQKDGWRMKFFVMYGCERSKLEK